MFLSCMFPALFIQTRTEQQRVIYPFYASVVYVVRCFVGLQQFIRLGCNLSEILKKGKCVENETDDYSKGWNYGFCVCL